MSLWVKINRGARANSIMHRASSAILEANPDLARKTDERERKKAKRKADRRNGVLGVLGFLTCLTLSVFVGSPFIGSLIVFVMALAFRLKKKTGNWYLGGTIVALVTSIGLG